MHTYGLFLAAISVLGFSCLTGAIPTQRPQQQPHELFHRADDDVMILDTDFNTRNYTSVSFRSIPILRPGYIYIFNVWDTSQDLQDIALLPYASRQGFGVYVLRQSRWFVSASAKGLAAVPYQEVQARFVVDFGTTGVTGRVFGVERPRPPEYRDITSPDMETWYDLAAWWRSWGDLFSTSAPEKQRTS